MSDTCVYRITSGHVFTFYCSPESYLSGIP